MDYLRRNLAPVSDEAWAEIYEEATRSLKSALSARKFVDVEGPKGWDLPGVAVGKLDVPDNQNGDVLYGVRQMQPLVEARVSFELNVWELDNLGRGAEDVELGPVADAAKKIARFEDDAIFNGFKPGAIEGLRDGAGTTLDWPQDIAQLPSTIAKGLVKFKENAVDGPYALVVGPKKYQELAAAPKGYPLIKQIERLLDHSTILATAIDDAYLVSLRGGDMELTLGGDLAIGNEAHDAKTVRLYFAESFTFRLFDPDAVMLMK